MKNRKNKITRTRTYIGAFTLVELLVVMAILGVLVALVAGNFRTAQIRGRDAQRKSDLKELSHSLELFYADYGKYPSESSGYIAACSYNPSLGTGTSCAWGEGEFTDGKTVYFKTMPEDPASSSNYRYKIVAGSSNQKYQLYTRLENTQDPAIDSDVEALGLSCGSGSCNMAVTSSNTNATEN